MEILGTLNTDESREIKNHWIPMYSATVACGLFGISDDFVDSYLSLDEKFVRNQNATFFVRASGDSMWPKVENGDILIVDTSLSLKNGAIGTFFYNGNPICKQWIKTENGFILRSINSKYPDLIIMESDQLELFGVVIGLARDLFL
jgi:DNA polymerase V